jgi:chromosome segregation ATPase
LLEYSQDEEDNPTVSEESTQDLDGGRSFEDRVFARFDAVDLSIGTLDARVQNLDTRVQNLDGRVQSLDGRVQNLDGRVQSLDGRVQSLDGRVQSLDGRVQSLDTRVQNLEARSYDTKPIWERALAEIIETKANVAEMRRDLTATKKTLIRRMDLVLLTSAESRADLQDMKDRVEKLEPPPGEGENGYD